jgi:hypothetical protein
MDYIILICSTTCHLYIFTPPYLIACMLNCDFNIHAIRSMSQSYLLQDAILRDGPIGMPARILGRPLITALHRRKVL